MRQEQWGNEEIPDKHASEKTNLMRYNHKRMLMEAKNSSALSLGQLLMTTVPEPRGRISPALVVVPRSETVPPRRRAAGRDDGGVFLLGLAPTFFGAVLPLSALPVSAFFFKAKMMV